MSKRNIFSELMEGLDALEQARAGKRTLRTTVVEYKPAPAMTSDEVREIRIGLNMSQPVFARHLRIEHRTVANWEQGVSRPNAQAAILLRLVARHPELLDEIAAL